MDQQLTEQEIGALMTTTEGRRKMATLLLGFCLVYLPHYFTKEPADFHRELIELLEDWSEQFIAIEGFRGSAKSSLAGLALILWAALEGKAMFILPINETDDVVKLTIANLREELENNQRIREDYGDMIVKSKGGAFTSFNEKNILLANGCRIMGRSRGQKIRGLRHKQYRPDLVVGDDIEEVDKVQKKEYRDKTEAWIRGTIIPAIEEAKGRIVILGNKLHVDAIMERLKNHKSFTYKAYSLFRDEIEDWQHCTWKGKYPTPESLAEQKQKVGITMWMREYLLKVLPPEGQIVKSEWIKRYKTLPEKVHKTGVGVDLAISQKQTADFTTMVGGVATIDQGLPKIYILPNPVNKHLTFHETLQQMQSLKVAYKIYSPPMFFIEDVAYQKAAIQEARRKLLIVKEMRAGQDKRARLESVAAFIQNGTILFPETGCEDLLTQMLFMGVESHDDLCLVGETLITTDQGQIPIKNIKAGDKVLTRKGYKKVLWSGKTGRKKVITRYGLTGTENHPVITKEGVKSLRCLSLHDTLYIWRGKLSFMEVKNIIDIRNQQSDHTEYIFGGTINGNLVLCHSIAKYGLIILEIYLQEWLFTIKTVIVSIIKNLISKSCQQKNTCYTTCRNQSELLCREKIFLKHKTKRKNGINQKLAENGTENMQKESGKIQPFTLENANDVKRLLKLSEKLQKHAQMLADITSTWQGEQDVYNLMVEDEHEFFANGILVHNCDAFVYLILGMIEQGLNKMEIVQIV